MSAANIAYLERRTTAAGPVSVQDMTCRRHKIPKGMLQSAPCQSRTWPSKSSGHYSSDGTVRKSPSCSTSYSWYPNTLAQA
eukprot:1672826-Rhodomonas_salina.2